MPEYDNTNTGAIWKNDRKETDRHPDFTGKLDVEGVEYWVSAWKRPPNAKEGYPALKFSIRRKERDYAEVGVGEVEGANGDVDPDFDDPIPF